jgi:hypothetical protein
MKVVATPQAPKIKIHQVVSHHLIMTIKIKTTNRSILVASLLTTKIHLQRSLIMTKRRKVKMSLSKMTVTKALRKKAQRIKGKMVCLKSNESDRIAVLISCLKWGSS